ncbi:ABC transporter substrate-binding protein [Pseudarthrobacter sulfonivorans]|uniref:ABC transporter substrate-binding protein n=1 Tax=Pseudarthrobacter sulfonivorans TaxID=121292 RepID=UPI00286535E5|nr:ABC transporter substrate-binding protein [Pseudarthrobacter sulfonivorans]MDR6417612.1 ABC-type transport system substrate-binding protein [Pseudarthrobacter sulfonivorans]
MKSSRMRPMRFAGAAIAAAFVLSACSPATAPAPTATAVGPIDKAVVSLPAPNLSFDPTKSVSATDRVTWSMINGSLMSLESDGTVTPGLAEKHEFNADFTTLTAHLRKDAKFSDGSALTASDVAATFTRHKGIEGSTISRLTDRIDSVVATDPLTVVFTFAKPYPSFVSELAAGALGIVPAGLLKNADGYYASPTVTSGQYTVASSWAGNKLELSANENYWAAKPVVDNLTLSVVEDANSAISQLQSGQIDFAADLAPNFVTQLKGAPNVNLVKSDVYGFFDVRMWNRSGPFADINMRKAVNAALDRKAIVTAIWGEENQPQAGFWPSSMPGHDGSKPVDQDLTAAKEYLAKTSCANGCSVRMMYSDQDFPFSGQLALMVQSQLGKVGIDVKLEKLDAATMIDRLFAGDYDLVPGAMASSGNVPDQLLANALLGTGFLKAEFTGYNSEEMNKLVATVFETDGEPRLEAVKKIEAQFSQDQPFATLAPWVRGSATTLPAGVFSLVGAEAKMGSLKE